MKGKLTVNCKNTMEGSPLVPDTDNICLWFPSTYVFTDLIDGLETNNRNKS
jgi:hypothetical protein